METDFKEIMGDMKTFAEKLERDAKDNTEQLKAAQILALMGINVQLNLIVSEMKGLNKILNFIENHAACLQKR